MKTIIRVGIYVIATLIAVAGFYFYSIINSSTYDEFIIYIAQLIQKPTWVTQIKGLFSFEEYTRVYSIRRIVPVFCAIISIGLIWKNKQIATILFQLLAYIKRHINLCRKQIVQLSNLEKILFYGGTLFFIIKAYYYVFIWPIQYDEAWTFNYFIKNTWLTSLVAPHNNFILYSIIAKGFYHLMPFIEPIYAIRFPLPLFALASGFVLFYAVRSFYSSQLAIIVYLLFLNIPAVTFYSLYARGYMVELFFVAIQFAIIIALFNGRKLNPPLQLLLGISTILAMYAAPIYVYSGIFIYASIFFFFLLRKNYSQIVQLFIVGIGAIAGTLFVFAPQIIGTKLGWLTNAVKHDSNFDRLKHLMVFSKKMSAFLLTGRNEFIFPIFLIISIVTFIFLMKRIRKRWTLWLIALSQVIAPFAILIIQEQSLFERLFTHTSIFIAITCALILFEWVKSTKLVFGLSVLFCGYLTYAAHNEKYLNWSNEYDVGIEKLAQLIKERNYTEVYSYYHYAKPALEYYSFKNEFPLDIYMWNESSRDYTDFSTRKFECVITNDRWLKLPNNALDGYKENWREGSTVLYIPIN